MSGYGFDLSEVRDAVENNYLSPLTTTYYLLLRKKCLGNFDEIDLEILEKQQRMLMENSKEEENEANDDVADKLSNGAKKSHSGHQMNGECNESKDLEKATEQSLDEIQGELVRTEEVITKDKNKRRAATARKLNVEAEEGSKNGNNAEVEKNIEEHIEKALRQENESIKKESKKIKEISNAKSTPKKDNNGTNKDSSNYYYKSSLNKDKKYSSPNNTKNYYKTETNNTNNNQADNSNFHIHQNINQQYHNNNFIIANPSYKFTNPVIIHHQHNLTDEIKNNPKNDEILSNKSKDYIENTKDDALVKSSSANKNFDFSGPYAIEAAKSTGKEVEVNLEKSYNTQGKSQNKSKTHSNNTNCNPQATALSHAQSLAQVQSVNYSSNDPDKTKKNRVVKKSSTSYKDKKDLISGNIQNKDNGNKDLSLNGSNDFTSNSKNRVENAFKHVNINNTSSKEMVLSNASNTFQTTQSTNTNHPSYRKLVNNTSATNYHTNSNNMFEKKNASHTGYSNTLANQKNPRKKIMINNKLNFNTSSNPKYLDDSTQHHNYNTGTSSNKEITQAVENIVKSPVNSQSMKNNLVVQKPNKYSGPICIELISDKDPL